MNRSRRIGVAALALSALTLMASVSSASANVVLAESYSATFSSIQQQYPGFGWKGGNLAKCSGTLSGSAEAPSEAVSLSPSGEMKCSIGTVKTNGCKLVFHPGSETEKGSNAFGGSFDIASGCSGISATDTQAACSANYPPQTGLSAKFENVTIEGKQEWRITLTTNNAQYTTSGNCGVGTYTNGSIEGSWLVKNSNGGSSFGVHVARPTGLFMVGEESPEWTNLPRFEVEGGYPAAIMGKQSAVQTFETSSGKLKCEFVNLGGFAAQATNEVHFWNPEYSKCKAFGLSATVQMNGCHYDAYVFNMGPAYVGDLVLSCPAGKQLEINAGGGSCVMKVSPQVWATSSYEVTGTGSARKVVDTLKGEGLEYSQAGAGCTGGNGTFHNGVLSGAETFEGWI